MANVILANVPIRQRHSSCYHSHACWQLASRKHVNSFSQHLPFIISIEWLSICLLIFVFNLYVSTCLVNCQSHHFPTHGNQNEPQIHHQISNSVNRSTTNHGKSSRKFDNQSFERSSITFNISSLTTIKHRSTPTTHSSTLTTPITPTTIITTTTAKTSKESKGQHGIEVISFCNDPGRPSKSQISPSQINYADGDTVVYTCDQYISLKQYRKCMHGNWLGDTPICGEAFRDNDMTLVRYFNRDNGVLLTEYNVTGQLSRWDKFGNTFISERFPEPLRGEGAAKYQIELTISKPAMVQMVRISFAVVDHLIEERLMNSQFDVTHCWVSNYRECVRVSNNSVSPWHFNSTRFDYWFFCRSKSNTDFEKELHDMSRVVQIETRANTEIEIDLATFILAEQYANNGNRSDPICGLPEVPVGLESRVVNDQNKYVFTCAKNFKRIDNFGGQFHLRTCGSDNKWHGQLPECFPIRTCPKFHLEPSNFLVEVFKYDRVYYVNQSEWLPIHGSRAFFRCKDETHIFVGKEIRVCEEDGEWSHSMPNCLVSFASDNLRTSTILIIVLATLVVTFILSSCTIFFFLKIRSQSKQPQHGLELADASYYASNGIDPVTGKLVDEVYESLEPLEARYASLNSYPIPGGDPMLLKTSPFPLSNTSDSYAHIVDYNSGFPVPAPRMKQPENDYYDDTVVDIQPGQLINSYEVMRKA